MAQPKALASLSATLLARKGTARPAMRPQGFGGFGLSASGSGVGLDDLGWNDMGQDDRASDEAIPRIILPASSVPPVLIERPIVKVDAVEGHQAILPPVAVKSVSIATATRMSRETAKKTEKGTRVAFTLRLEADRHLRLRLASAVTKCSAQHLVSQALDVFLQSLPEVDALIAQLPPAKSGTR